MTEWKAYGGQLDISEDNFLSLMSEDGSTKDDVKIPDGEVGEKIKKSFNDDKDLSMSPICCPSNWRNADQFLDVVVLTAMGEESCIDFKEASK